MSELNYTIRSGPTFFLISFFENPKLNKKIEEFANSYDVNRAPITVRPWETIRINFTRNDYIVLFAGNHSYTLRHPEIFKKAMELIPEAEKLNFLLWLEEMV